MQYCQRRVLFLRRQRGPVLLHGFPEEGLSGIPDEDRARRRQLHLRGRQDVPIIRPRQQQQLLKMQKRVRTRPDGRQQIRLAQDLQDLPKPEL